MNLLNINIEELSYKKAKEFIDEIDINKEEVMRTLYN